MSFQLPTRPLACISPPAPLSLESSLKVTTGFANGGILGWHKSHSFHERPTACGRRVHCRRSGRQGVRAGRPHGGHVLPVRAYREHTLLRWDPQASTLHFGGRSPRFTPKTLRNTDSKQNETVSP